MTSVSHLRAFQALQLALKLGSMKAAARELAITPAAVGQRIRLLEDYLGVDLVVRGRSGLRPTDELAAAKAHLDAAFRELETTCSILDLQRVQEIHIVADSDWVDLWLKPRLRRFRDIAPNTLFCINGEGDVPTRLGDADCEIWLGPTQSREGEETLFRDYLLPVSSPENTRRVSRSPAESRLEGFPLLHLDCYVINAGEAGWPEWTSRFGRRATAPERGIRYGRLSQALEAVYANAGLVICGLALVSGQLEEGRLSLPFDRRDGFVANNSYRAWFRPAAMKRASLARFRDWLIDQSRQTEQSLQPLIQR